MGAFQQKPGQFALFKNDKQGNDARPDYRGDGLDLDGTPITVAAWLKPTKSGGKFMACQIQPKDRDRHSEPPPEKRVPGKGSAETPGSFDEMEDSIPF